MHWLTYGCITCLQTPRCNLQSPKESLNVDNMQLATRNAIKMDGKLSYTKIFEKSSVRLISIHPVCHRTYAMLYIYWITLRCRRYCEGVNIQYSSCVVSCLNQVHAKHNTCKYLKLARQTLFTLEMVSRRVPHSVNSKSKWGLPWQIIAPLVKLCVALQRTFSGKNCIHSKFVWLLTTCFTSNLYSNYRVTEGSPVFGETLPRP